MDLELGIELALTISLPQAFHANNEPLTTARFLRIIREELLPGYDPEIFSNEGNYQS